VVKKKGSGRGSERHRKKKGKDRAEKNAVEVEPKSSDAEVPPKDFREVRENIAALVKNSASSIAAAVIDVAKTGQLAQAKYLFETVGLYPTGDETQSEPEESLAQILLKRMGLPTEPVNQAAASAPEVGGGRSPGERRPDESCNLKVVGKKFGSGEDAVK
jgi:hypothetical protein